MKDTELQAQELRAARNGQKAKSRAQKQKGECLQKKEKASTSCSRSMSISKTTFALRIISERSMKIFRHEIWPIFRGKVQLAIG